MSVYYELYDDNDTKERKYMTYTTRNHPEITPSRISSSHLSLAHMRQSDTICSVSISSAVSSASVLKDTRIVSIDLLDSFISFLDVSEKTLATYSRALKQLFAYFSRHHIAKPTSDDILQFKKELEHTGHKASTIALYLAASRRFFSWCESKGIYDNIAQGIKAPKQERGHKRDFLGAAQLKAMFAGMSTRTLAEKRDYAILSLLSVCGLRTVEVSRANVEDMRVLGECTVLYVQGKGCKDKAEFVKLPAPVLTAITAYLEARGKVSETAPLFAGIGNRNKGGRLTTYTISQVAKQAMKNAGYNTPRLTAHSLRHSAVTLALFGGMDLQDVQSFARHANISTTTIYAHTVDRIRSQCESVVASAIF